MTIKSKKDIDFGLIAFEIEQIDEVVNHVGFKFDKNDYLMDGKKTIKCNCCDHVIRKKNLGNILPGSNIVYCDNPSCFAEYINKHLGL